MPVAKAGTATATKAAPPAPRTTRATRTATKSSNKVVDSADELVEGLGKLAIQPNKRATAKSSTTAPSSISGTVAPSSAKATARKPPASASSRAVPASTSSKPEIKGKVKANASSLEDSLPWANPCGETSMRPLDRVRGAMQAVNTASKEIAAAVASGFKYTHSSQPAKPVPGKGKGKEETSEKEWSIEKVDNAIETCRIAFRVLRDLDVQGHLQNKALDVERSSVGVVGKCISLGSYRLAMKLLVDSRPALLRLYKPRPMSIQKPNGTATPASNTTSSSKSTVSKDKDKPSSVKAGASLASRKAPGTARSRIISGQTSSIPVGVSEEWLEMGSLPTPEEGTDLSETLRSLLFSVMMAAWICLVDLSKDTAQLLPAMTIPRDSFNVEDKRLHPLLLALSLPIPQTTFYLHNFYRQVTVKIVSPSDPSYLHLRHLSLLAMSITITPLPESRTTPTQFWDTTHRVILNFVKEDEGKEKLREAAAVLDHIVGWVESLSDVRGQKGWCEGKGWLGLVEMWVGLGRRLGDSAVIDKPLSLLASSTSIASPSRQIEAGPSTPPSLSSVKSNTQSPESKSSVKSRKIPNPDAEIARICGDLAKASLILDKASSEKTLSSTIESLGSEDLMLLAHAISSLPEDEQFIDVAGKATRAYERVRRGCLKLLGHTGQASSAETQRIRDWLDASIEFTESLTAASILNATLTKDLISGLTDTMIHLLKPSYSSSLPHVQRARAVIDQSADRMTDRDRADCLRCLASIAYSGAGQSYRASRAEEALALTQISCSWGTEALDLIGEGSSDDKSLVALRDGMSKKWELLAGCQQRSGNKEEMFTSYSHVFATQSPSTLSQIALASDSTPLNEVLTPHKELKNSMTRLISLILYEPAIYFTHGTRLIRLMRDHAVPVAAIGAMAEMLMSALEEGEWKEDVARISLELGDAILDLYGEDYPIRRIRVLSKMMGTILSSGQSFDRFSTLVQKVNSASDQQDLGKDINLLPFKAEYVSYTLISRAMQIYHSAPHPTLEILQATKEVVEKLRQIILPPTPTSQSGLTATAENDAPKKKTPLGRSTTTKAVRPTRGTARTVSEPKKAVAPPPAKKVVSKKSTDALTAQKRRSSVLPTLVFDDLKRLTGLLGSLSTLLGLLGHSLQQIEVLKLLRAFQRNKEDLVDDYILRSAQLASEYQKLGKTSRAAFVFSQAHKVIEHSKVMVSAKVRIEMGLRFAAFLALKGDVAKAQEVYSEAASLETEIEENKTGSYVTRVVDRCQSLERAAWARRAAAAFYAAQDNAAGAIMQLSASFRLFSRAADAICRIASDAPRAPATGPVDKAVTEDDPFGAPLPPSAKPKIDGADEPSKDTKSANAQANQTSFSGKHLSAYQWNIAFSLLSTTLDLSNAFAYRGTVKDCEYFLKLAAGIAEVVKSDIMQARIESKQAELYFRMRKFEQMGEKLESANTALNTIEGPDMVDLNVLKGDLYSRTEMLEEAEQVFQATSKDIEGLDRVFVANEAVLPTVRASLTNSKLGKGKEPLLPAALAHILRQYAWLLKEAGSKQECEELLQQIRSLPSSTETKAKELLLEGKIALHEAFNTFKTDLFMSSLTESAVAMPMGAPTKRVADRQSTRQSIQTVLSRAEEAFLSAISLVSGSGKIEGMRQACLALALLRTFQTSLGQGSEAITASAAGMLASSSAITLQRELLEAIDCKFVDIVNADLTWPSFVNTDKETEQAQGMDVDKLDDSIEVVTEDLDDHDGKLRSYWDIIKAKYSANPIVSTDPVALDILPTEWSVISINVTDDRNTMFISRHQRNHQPIVFCLPLDRQGRREGEDDESLFTFDSAINEMKDIIDRSNDTARTAKGVVTREDKIAWWEERFRLDAKMKALCESIEFVWLGAFKTIFSPRLPNSNILIADLKERLAKIFDSALSATGGGSSNPRSRVSSVPTMPQVELDDSLLECFVNLSSKCKDEEIEDLVYFILDVYQFHGVPVALSELDIDQISIDVKGALEKIESRITSSGLTPSKDEHLFLALDKNIQPFPWESIPILRGRPISRIPSLSFMLDQVKMSTHLRPSLSQSTTILNGTEQGNAKDQEEGLRRTINSRKTFYILNPSGDLTKTEEHFKSYIDEMVQKAGWKGIVGRPPTELEMVAALKDYDLVLYFGHGGSEQYIRSHKIRHLPQCATTMLWGCSSGHLKEQGDLDRTGTAWHYMIGGCPSLTANLWDVTDRDIDRLSAHVLKQLHLDSAHLPDSKSRSNTLLPLSELSTVQAVNASREECKLKYLTGAAPVVYGLPVWVH
uniref:separase n=1 Tax=Kwoniella dejecticola CBS 10117 TaxID=1296121 RepID=A0A1A6A873_9TREE|nr:uncharacterized protein I303_03986 [Kwoniella dejecticola CBS 10117]OBR86264.1 hypothetical protein I303_03986 [Kwoniella dejecticola CBS 10117]